MSSVHGLRWWNSDHVIMATILCFYISVSAVCLTLNITLVRFFFHCFTDFILFSQH